MFTLPPGAARIARGTCLRLLAGREMLYTGRILHSKFKTLYQQYFHFSELPFSIAPDPHFMFMSERHQEGLGHLIYGITMTGGFVALTGEVGTGKTTLCRCLLQQLPDNVDIALILNPKLNAIELLTTLCDELHIAYDNNQQTLKILIDQINQYLLAAYAKGRRTVLLIDEAQNLSLEVLEQIRLLTNLETSKTKLLQIVLVGQPELKQLLQQQALRQLNQRITARYHLLPLSYAETRAYICHRLAVCNGNPDLFETGALKMIYRFSAGVPRIINIICDRALLGAYATNRRRISPEIIRRAAQETLDLGRQRYRFDVAWGLVLVGGIALGGYVFNQTSVIDKPAEPVPPDQLPKTGFIPPEKVMPMAAKSEVPPVPQPVKPKVEENAFNAWLADPAWSESAALLQALKVWKKTVPADNQVDCQYLGRAGLNCLYARANWKDLLTLNRPAILEFSLSADEKRYALLVGVNKGQPVFRGDQDVSFPLDAVLQAWNGHYLIPWQTPRPGLIEIKPLQTSANVIWLRQQLGSVSGVQTKSAQPQLYDEPLKAQVMDFQRRHHLPVDGVVGARTLIHLENGTGAAGSPHLKITD